MIKPSPDFSSFLTNSVTFEQWREFVNQSYYFSYEKNVGFTAESHESLFRVFAIDEPGLHFSVLNVSQTLVLCKHDEIQNALASIDSIFLFYLQVFISWVSIPDYVLGSSLPKSLYWIPPS